MSKTIPDIHLILKEFDKLPKFPDGRIDYSSSDKAPVLTCFVRFEDKILLLKRSDRVGTYRGKWHTVAGYIDEPKPIQQKALEELEEEPDIHREDVSSFTRVSPMSFLTRAQRRAGTSTPS